MRVLAAIVLLGLITACATPYYPVYDSGEGGYYIAETESSDTYYGGGSSYYGGGLSSLNYIGVNPWWGFTYYSPYFYPHHFSVWYPPWPHSYYGWYGGYNPYWCPPYRMHRYTGPLRVADNPNVIPVISQPLPGVYPTYPVPVTALVPPSDSRSFRKHSSYRPAPVVVPDSRGAAFRSAQPAPSRSMPTLTIPPRSSAGFSRSSLSVKPFPRSSADSSRISSASDK